MSGIYTQATDGYIVNVRPPKGEWACGSEARVVMCALEVSFYNPGTVVLTADEQRRTLNKRYHMVFQSKVPRPHQKVTQEEAQRDQAGLVSAEMFEEDVAVTDKELASTLEDRATG